MASKSGASHRGTPPTTAPNSSPPQYLAKARKIDVKFNGAVAGTPAGPFCKPFRGKFRGRQGGFTPVGSPSKRGFENRQQGGSFCLAGHMN